MSIVIVGGNDRMSSRYVEICKKYKCKAKVYIKMPTDFDSKIGNPDLVVVFTNACSHKLLNGVKQNANKKDLLVEMVHSASVSALEKTLEKHCAC